jgi:DNA-binding NarL/FixJ family response regulator
MERARLVLVDDHGLMLEGLRAALQDTYDIVALVGSGAEGVRAVRKHHPDLVLLDLSLPDQSGLEVIQELHGIAARVKILVVTMHRDRVLADAALQSGAQGFVPKDADVAELRHAVSEVLAGNNYVSPLVPQRLSYRSTDKLQFALSQLTPTQQRIIRLIGEGRSSASIARRLHLTKATITFHRVRIRQTLGLKDEWALLRHAILIRLSEAESRVRSARSP